MDDSSDNSISSINNSLLLVSPKKSYSKTSSSMNNYTSTSTPNNKTPNSKTPNNNLSKSSSPSNIYTPNGLSTPNYKIEKNYKTTNNKVKRSLNTSYIANTSNATPIVVSSPVIKDNKDSSIYLGITYLKSTEPYVIELYKFNKIESEELVKFDNDLICGSDNFNYIEYFNLVCKDKLDILISDLEKRNHFELNDYYNKLSLLNIPSYQINNNTNSLKKSDNIYKRNTLKLEFNNNKINKEFNIILYNVKTQIISKTLDVKNDDSDDKGRSIKKLNKTAICNLIIDHTRLFKTVESMHLCILLSYVENLWLLSLVYDLYNKPYFKTFYYSFTKLMVNERIDYAIAEIKNAGLFQLNICNIDYNEIFNSLTSNGLATSLYFIQRINTAFKNKRIDFETTLYLRQCFINSIELFHPDFVLCYSNSMEMMADMPYLIPPKDSRIHFIAEPEQVEEMADFILSEIKSNNGPKDSVESKLISELYKWTGTRYKSIISLDTESLCSFYRTEKYGAAARQKISKIRSKILNTAEDGPGDVQPPVLMQLNFRSVTFLIDLPSAGVSLDPILTQLFTDPLILKVGVGFKGDLSSLKGCYPFQCYDAIGPFVDMQNLFAASYPDFPNVVSLANMCLICLHAPLSKQAQLSNWCIRPLADNQRIYAAMDVIVLPLVFDALLATAFKREEVTDGVKNLLLGHVSSKDKKGKTNVQIHAEQAIREKRMVVIKNLPFDLLEDDFIALVSSYGDCEEISLMKSNDGKSKGQGRTIFKTTEIAESAVKKLHDCHILGRKTKAHIVEI